MIRNHFVLCAFALLAACERPAEQVEAPVAPVAPSAASAVAAAGPSETDAFQAAWGSASPVTYRAPDAGPDDEPTTYSTGKLIPLGNDRFALVSEGQGGDSHASIGALAIHYLTRTPAGFIRTGAWPNIGGGGVFGAPPQWAVRTDLTPAPALVTTFGGTWQGYSCSSSQLVELTSDRPILRTNAIPIAYDDSGARGQGGEEMTGALAPDIKGQSFSVRYTGDRTASVRYALRGQRYEATTSPELLTC